jgi:hypothetical protein
MQEKGFADTQMMGSDALWLDRGKTGAWWT